MKEQQQKKNLRLCTNIIRTVYEELSGAESTKAPSWALDFCFKQSSHYALMEIADNMRHSRSDGKKQHTPVMCDTEQLGDPQ